MDTPTSVLRSANTSRRWRIAAFVGLILLVQGGLAYLLTWVDPPREPILVDLRVTSYPMWSVPKARQADHNKLTRAEIRRTLDGLAKHNTSEPVVVHLSAIALHGASGNVLVVPSDGTPADPATWLPLAEILEKLKACPSPCKLLVFEWLPPPALDRVGSIHHDIAAVLPGELEAVPDDHRLVLTACAAGQQTHYSHELGQSAFAHYFQQAWAGRADGYGDARDSRISVKELATFLHARVDRWAQRNRGARQTPALLGTGNDFALTTVDPNRTKEPAPASAEPRYSEMLVRSWQESADARLSAREFQWRRATNLWMEQNRASTEEVIGTLLIHNPLPLGREQAVSFAPPPYPESTKKLLDEQRRLLDQQLVGAKPTEAERFKKRFVEDMRARLPGDEIDAAVFAHVLADPRLDPGTLRMFDQMLHPAANAMPRTAEALRLRQLADLAMRIEVQAWPRDHIEALLRATELGAKALQQTPHVPGYFALLADPSMAQHAGEVRLYTRGHANLDDARKLLTDAQNQFGRLIKLNERWGRCARLLDEASAELPWYLEALEALPELSEPWEKAAASARALADTLQPTPTEKAPWAARVESIARHIDVAEKHLGMLQQHRQALHAPFSKAALARLERQCRAPNADATVRQTAEAILSVAAPVLRADDRIALWQAAQSLARRLNDETLALDRQDDSAHQITPTAVTRPSVEDESRWASARARRQIALFELAGVADDHLQPLRSSRDKYKLGAEIHALAYKQVPQQWQQETDWRAKERLAWAMPPLALLREVDGEKAAPMLAHLREQKDLRDRWLHEHHRYLARDLEGLDVNSPGIIAACEFYLHAARKPRVDTRPDAYVRLNVSAAVDALTERQPYAQVWLEVTRHVPPGAFGPVELQVHRTDDAWLEVAPESATLPALSASKEPRTLTSKIPLKAVRKPKAERTGLPPPLGFLVEAKFEGRSYHRAITVPITPSTQDLQILVSADPDEPATTVNDIRVRPGKMKQPHFVYLRNLTNRTQKVNVEVAVGKTIMHKGRLMTLEPDAVRKVLFDQSTIAPSAELHGPLEVRVLDQDRARVLQQRTLRVEILDPREYVQTADASYEPGQIGDNKWAIQVQASKPIVGPAIAAQLVLPVERIPGLMSIGGGTLKVELPTHSKAPRTLFAEKLRLLPSLNEEGPVYLHIDGVARAFVYRTTFSRVGDPTVPKADQRPAVRIVAPPCVMAGVNCLIDVEVDNAPAGAKLDVALGRLLEDGAFKPETVREFPDAKKRRVGMETTKDALVFDASIADWTATFDTRAAVGPRALRARLLDSAGKEIAHMEQSMVIDDSPPIARFAPMRGQVQRGSVLRVEANGVDPESGVAQVVFFLGRPDKGEIPLAAPRIKAVPTNRENTLWTGGLQVPADHKGPLAVSVQVVNHAGMASIETITLEVTDREPGKTGLGEIHGQVNEGPRPQPNLLVTLLDQAGKEIARTKTRADGSYVFTQLTPGRYRVVCVKPESQRRAVLDVTVGADRAARADLALAL